MSPSFLQAVAASTFGPELPVIHPGVPVPASTQQWHPLLPQSAAFGFVSAEQQDASHIRLGRRSAFLQASVVLIGEPESPMIQLESVIDLAQQ